MVIDHKLDLTKSKYTFYYVYAAIGTLHFKLGQNVMWNIALLRADKNLIENLTDTMLDKEHGFTILKYINEGVVNLKSIR